jgi:two-component system, response regulator YesN
MQTTVEQRKRRPALEKPARILLVDDDPDLLVGLSDALDFWLAPVVIDTCLSPHEALQSLQASPYRYQLIATDLCMPRINGLTLIRQARRLCPHVPMVLMTAYDLVPYSEEAYGLGVYDTICKPFVREEMIAVFRRALAQARLDH